MSNLFNNSNNLKNKLFLTAVLLSGIYFAINAFLLQSLLNILIVMIFVVSSLILYCLLGTISYMQNQYENSLEILILKSDISRYEDNIKCSADGNIKALKSLLTEVRVQLGVQNSNFRQKLSPYLLGKSISTTISLLSAAYLTYSSCISNRNALSIFL